MSNLSINNVQNAGVNGVNEIKFKGKSKEYNADNKESNNEGMKTSTKLMIGATALASVVALSIAGRKGKLGENIQKFLGGIKKTVKDAEKTVKKEAPVTTSSTAEAMGEAENKIKKLTEDELKNLLEKKSAEATEEEIKNAIFAKYDDPIILKDLLAKNIKEAEKNSNVGDIVEAYHSKLEHLKWVQTTLDNMK